ncbi:MAG TPA: hypothetical protein VNG33_06595 [Polyangiaceae bacterium]|nr:hypothetical protein [Polyangiaceae bacterium]
MDPNVLRVLTDPEARKDPAQLRAALGAMSKSTRQAVFDSVRINGIVMTGVGYAMIVGAAGAAAASLLGLLPKELGYSGILLAAMGALFIFLSRFTALPPRSLLRNGTALVATVRQVKSIGRTIGVSKPGLNATLSQVTVVLSIPQLGPAGSEIEHREFILGSDLSRLQVGSTINVRSDPKRPERLAFDWDSAG